MSAKPAYFRLAASVAIVRDFAGSVALTITPKDGDAVHFLLSATQARHLKAAIPEAK